MRLVAEPGGGRDRAGGFAAPQPLAGAADADIDEIGMRRQPGLAPEGPDQVMPRQARALGEVGQRQILVIALFEQFLRLCDRPALAPDLADREIGMARQAPAIGAQQAFLDAYRSGAGDLPGLDNLDLLAFFMLEKAAYELLYEASNRPAWLSIPLHGLQRLMIRILGDDLRSPA